ncbi:MAG: hypothetical protein IT337_15590, partial [Thermomicrobiales bacterium]|nr:hypothetical protein [Thermomicrobiales bacterium]
MEPQYIRAYTERTADSRPGDAIRFIASTSDVARDGMIVEAKGWQLDNFKRNPVFLWAHDYWAPPIGKVTDVRIEGDNLIADVVFDQDDPESQRIERKYRNGILSAVSVGFNIIDYTPAANGDPMRATRAELLELSGVPVPSDPKALKDRQRTVYRHLSDELARIADSDDTHSPDSNGDESARPSWDETSRSMLELFQPYGLRPDPIRRAEYDDLAREYARHRKTPPEFATAAELEAFDDDALRGRFLEGEADLHADHFTRLISRAGAVLSRKNLEDLNAAIALINGVMDRAKKETDTDTESDD